MPSHHRHHRRAPRGFDLEYYLDVAKRRWWLVALLVASAVGTTLHLTAGQIPMYTARVSLLMSDTGPLLTPTLRAPRLEQDLETVRAHAVVQPVSDSTRFALQIDDRPWLRSRILLDPVVDSEARPRQFTLSPEGAGLALRGVGEEEVLATIGRGDRVVGPGFAFGPVDPESLREGITLSVRSRTEATSVLRSRIVVEEESEPGTMSLTFSDGDPEFAAAVLNLVAESYVAHSLATSKGGYGTRRASIRKQIDLLSDSLASAQSELAAFSRADPTVNPELEAQAILVAALDTEDAIGTLLFNEEVLSSVVDALRGGGLPNDSVFPVIAKAAPLMPGAAGSFRRFRELTTERRTLTAARAGGLTEANPQVVALDAEIETVKGQILSMAEGTLMTARAALRESEARIGNLRSDMSGLRARTAEFDRVHTWIGAIEELLNVLRTEYWQAQIEAGAESGDVQILDRADPPLRPDPSWRFVLVSIAFAGALALAMGIAVGWDSLDTTVRRESDVNGLAGLQILGTIPGIAEKWGDPKAPLVGKEAFRGLRTNLRYALPDSPRVLAVASAEPGEGKSTVVTNLALTIAESGTRVLLIDADMRRPTAHTVIGVERRPGLSDVLEVGVPFANAVVPSEAHDLLWMLPAGAPTQRSAELLGSDVFERLLAEVPPEFGVVLLDTSPVLAVTDVSIVGPRVEALVLVARANKTDSKCLARAVSQLLAVGTRVAGVVLNDVPLNDVAYSSYYDSYFDGAAPDRRQRPVLQT